MTGYRVSQSLQGLPEDLDQDQDEDEAQEGEHGHRQDQCKGDWLPGHMSKNTETEPAPVPD